MKVVLFCGGMGMRMREYSDAVPKPMVPVGGKPILWHLMNYYASYGHTEFILCVGWKGDVIRDYFAALGSTDPKVRSASELASAHPDWRVTFVDSGPDSSVGERLRAAHDAVGSDEYFLANYADGLSDVPLDDVISFGRRAGYIATFVAVRPTQSFHVVQVRDDGAVTSIQPVSSGDQRINGGFFVMRNEIFDVLEPGEDLVDAPFARLVERKALGAYRYDGFWACMDTFKEKQQLDEIHAEGRVAWRRIPRPGRAADRWPAPPTTERTRRRRRAA